MYAKLHVEASAHAALQQSMKTRETDKHREEDTALCDSVSDKSAEGWQQTIICQCGLKDHLRSSVSLCALWLDSASHLKVCVLFRAAMTPGERLMVPCMLAHASISCADTVQRSFTCLDYKVHQ